MKTKVKYQQKRGIERREDLRALALGIIGQLGVAEFSMGMLAKKANISNGSLYRFWPSKTELIASVAEVEFAPLKAKYLSAMSGCESVEDVRLAVRNHFIYFHDTIRERPELIDLWNGLRADKVLQDLDEKDAIENARIMCEKIAPFCSNISFDDLWEVCIMLIYIGSATARRAASLPVVKANKMIDQMFESAWEVIEKEIDKS